MDRPLPPKRLTATIAEKRSVADDIMWFRLSLSEPIEFLPGQYVDLRFPGESRYHAFSIASGPARKEEVELVVKRVHAFTERLFQSPEGSALECLAPLGRFLQGVTDDLVMIAGGVGITPFLSVVRQARDAQKEDKEYWLFVSCRSREQFCVEEELRRLPTENPHIHVVLTLTRETPDGWDQERGRVDTAMLLRHLGSLDGKTFATCGPAQMVEAVTAMLGEAGIPDDKVLRESWG